MEQSTLSTDLFQPLHHSERKHGTTRPSLSYWQDAWRRLRESRRALISLYLVLALLLFTLVGPLLWQVSPSSQDLDQVSQPPWADRTAVIVAPYSLWHGETSDASGSGLRTASPANTQAVRLLWDPLPQASGG